MLYRIKFNLPLILITLIASSPAQVFAKTFRWTDRGTATDSNDYREYRAKIKYRIEIDEKDICTIKLHIHAQMNGENSSRKISYSTYVDAKSVSLSYGQTFSYKRPENRSGKMLTIDGYNNLKFKNEEEKFMKDEAVLVLSNIDFDLYDKGDGLNELNQYTSRLTSKCKEHDAREQAKKDAYLESQKVYYDDTTSLALSNKALHYLTSNEYLNSVSFTGSSMSISDFFIATGKNHLDEKLTSLSQTEDKEIRSCVASQERHFTEFFYREKESAEKARVIPWMYSFNIQTPVFHLLDTRHSGNEGVTRKAHLSKDAKWHVYFVLGKPSSRYDELHNKSDCYAVSSNHLASLANKFYKNNRFQTAKASLDKKLETLIAKENKRREDENRILFYEGFKKNPAGTLKTMEKNLTTQLKKLTQKEIKSKEFIEQIEIARKNYLELIRLVKKSHPDFYKENYKRFTSKNWYQRYLN